MNTLRLILVPLFMITILGTTDVQNRSANVSFPAVDIFAGKTGLEASNQDSIIYENDSVFTIESYKEELSKDGEWIKVEKDQIDPDGVTGRSDELDSDIDGEWVWRPYNVDPDWSPYTNGYWVYTNCGWMWVSYYHWGWRTCHYGRWWWSPIWGWVWSPGFIWAPAWVVWMYYDDYCGWYPISPRIRWHHHHGWHCHNMRFHVRRWTFCNNNSFNVHINQEVIVDPPMNKKIIDQATFVSVINVIDKQVVNKGPDKNLIEKATGKEIEIKNAKKFHNVKGFISDDGNMQGEKKVYNDKERYRNGDNGNKKSYDNGSKNTDTPEKNDGGYNTDTPGKNDGGKNTDTPQKNDGNKNNDGVKKESKSPSPKQYSPPPQEKKKPDPPPQEKKQDPPKNNDSYKKSDPPKNNDSYRNSDPPQHHSAPPPPVKKREPPPPPVKDKGSNESKTEDVKTDRK